MSSVNDHNYEKYLYAVIRKPQEGKTFICIKDIQSKGNEIHFIVTMNSIKSNKQFFDRLNVDFKGNICVFNSKKEKDIKYKHSNNVLDIKDFIIRKKINIVIMCGHSKRFKKSIIKLIELLKDSKDFEKTNKKIYIHIDEAHAYIPTHRDKIEKMNNFNIVDRITLYTATSNNLLVDVKDKGNDIFKTMFIVDCSKTYNITRSDDYFGIKDCELRLFNEKFNYIKEDINRRIIERYNPGRTTWYEKKSPFSLGNEMEHLSFINAILSNFRDNDIIINNKFSYNFIPAFVRKVTHIKTARLIYKYFKNAIVLIINGDGTQAFVDKKQKKIVHDNEPAVEIYNFVKKYPNRPVFITGFYCIGMSVTLINEKIGNFDNVIFTHKHFLNSFRGPDILYQLCRFLFNAINWKDKTKIKKTKFWTNCEEVFNIVLEYEMQDDNIIENMSGSLRTQSELIGDIPVKKKKIPKEKKFAKLEPYIKYNIKQIGTIEIGWDDNDEIKSLENKVNKYYKKFCDKSPVGRSMPKKNKNGFYECSITKMKGVQCDNYNILEGMKWWSNFCINNSDKLKYIRIYVIYTEDKKKYTFYLRMLTINEDGKEILKEILN